MKHIGPIWAVCLWMLVLAGCAARAKPQDPHRVANQYWKHVREGQIAEAEALCVFDNDETRTQWREAVARYGRENGNPPRQGKLFPEAYRADLSPDGVTADVHVLWRWLFQDGIWGDSYTYHMKHQPDGWRMLYREVDAAPVYPGPKAWLKAPPGFLVKVFAGNLDRPRFMAFDPKGRLMVAEMGAGAVTVLPDDNRDGRADRKIIFAGDLNLPHSIAWHEGRAYVACATQVVAFSDLNGDGVADTRQVVVDGLPGGAGHRTRTIVFGADGGMYVSIGSSSNVGLESDPRRAAVMRFEPDGSKGRVYASGLRNAVGMAVHPGTGRIWVTVNERDRIGDDIPPDRLDILVDGGFFGWPYLYFLRGKPVLNPEYPPDPRPRRRATAPALEFQAHSAPLGIAFYTGKQFPREYWGDAFVAFHGSWNRSVPTGYKVVRVRVKDNRPVGYEDFISGFLRLDPVRKTGRPAGVAVGPDGSLYFTDDANGLLYRVTYSAGRAAAAPAKRAP